MTHLLFRSHMPASADAVLEWHCRPGAFERLSPPWESVKVIERAGTIKDGGRVVLAVRAGGFWRRWVAQHHDYQPGRQFCDVQTEGPFREWRHCHRVIPDGEGCYLEDEIDYTLPMGFVGGLVAGGMIRRQIDQMFRYRHEITTRDLALHQKYSEGSAMRIAITGSTGLVGSALAPFLTTGSHQVVRIVRQRQFDDEIAWSPDAGKIEADRLEGLDAVVHLAGENIAARRWNAAQKARIRDSRVQGTKLLCESLARLRHPPRVLVSASAIGYYGDRADEELTETSTIGSGFLPDVCREWEAATAPAEHAGIRVVHLRFGIILSPKGGALSEMLTPFRFGLGGRIGSGRQWMSWISLDDVIGCIYHALNTESLKGPVNAVAPKPASNLEFTKTLGRVLRRPTIFPMPAFAARLAFGEMANDLLLASTRVRPTALLDSGYSFMHTELEQALRHLLGKSHTVSIAGHNDRVAAVGHLTVENMRVK